MAVAVKSIRDVSPTRQAGIRQKARQPLARCVAMKPR